MNIRHISAEDWKTFREQFPSAYSFLQSASLKGEEKALRAELPYAHGKGRREWIEQRLADFDRSREAFSAIYQEERP
jgi:hypothetical protein